jgi:hypothetical protein
MGLGGNGSGAGSVPAKSTVTGPAYSVRKTALPGSTVGLGSNAGQTTQARTGHPGILSGDMPPGWFGCGQFWQGSLAACPIMPADLGIAMPAIGLTPAPAGIAIAKAMITTRNTRMAERTINRSYCRACRISSRPSRRRFAIFSPRDPTSAQPAE